MENSNTLEVLGVFTIIKKLLLFMILGVLLINTVSALETTYTPSTKQTCILENNMKTCNLEIHSGTAFVNEDKIWKPITEARSLKGTGVKCIIKSDDYNLVECKDWNSTTVKVDLSIRESRLNMLLTKIIGTSVISPIRKYKLNKSGDRVYSKDFERDISFEWYNKEKEFTFELKQGEVLEYGQNSTELILQDANTENLEDAQGWETNPDDNYNTGEIASGGAGTGADFVSWIKFTGYDSISAGAKILNASLSLDNNQVRGCTTEMKSVSDQGWIETAVTWNTRPTGVGGSVSQTVLPVESARDYWNVTGYFQDEYESGVNISFQITMVGTGTAATNFLSKEDGTESNRPMLTILWEVSDNPPIVRLQEPANETTTYGVTTNFIFNVTDTEGTIENCSLFFQHSFGDDWELNQTDDTITELSNQIFPVELAYENLYWKVGCYDDAHQQANSSARNFTRLEAIPIVTNNFPPDNLETYTPYQNFTYQVTIPLGTIASCNLWIDDILNLTDSNIEEGVNQTFNLSTLDYGQHLWHIQCEDTGGKLGNSSEWNVSRLTAYPIISNEFPKTNAFDYTPYVNFTYNTTIPYGSISSCSLWLNGVNNETDSNIELNINQTFNKTIGFDDNNWSIECISDLGIKGNSTISFNYSRIRAYPNVDLQFPTDDLYTNDRYINFTYNTTIPYGSISSCSLWLNGTLNQTDNNIEQLINQTFNVTLNNSHYWNWEIECLSDGGLKSNSTIYSFIFNTPPTIPTLILPINNTLTANEGLLITCNGSSDENGDTIKYSIWGDKVGVTKSIQQNTTSSTFTWMSLHQSKYEWYCRANDGFEASAFIPLRTFTVMDAGSFNMTKHSTCTSGLTSAMCFDFKDEENLTALNTNVDYNFEVSLTNSSVLKIYGSYDNATNLCLCTNSSLYNNYSLSYGEIQYAKMGFIDRRYYAFQNTRLTNTQVNDTLFLLLNGQATSFLFEFKSTGLDPYTSKYTSLLRWYPDLDTYDTVDMGKTDDKGQTIMRVVTEDVDYRVGLYYQNGSLIKLLEPVRFACLESPCSYSSIIQEDPSDYTEFLDIEASLTWDASTKVFTFIYNDPSQNTNTMNLTVYRETGLSSLAICEDAGSGYTGVLTCNVSAYTGNLKAIVYRSASPEVPIAQRIVTIFSSVFKGTLGLFISIIVFILFVMAGAIFGVIPAIVMGLASFIFALRLGVVSLEVAVGLGTLGAIVVHFMKRV